LVSLRARHKGKHKDREGQENSGTVTPQNARSIAPSTGNGPLIPNTIQDVTPVSTETADDENRLLSLPIEELKTLGGRSVNPKVALFRGALLEGQLSSEEMQAARGKTVEEANDDIASILVNSAVDNSAL
jgi:hypothetical protein